jgi:nucleotide-binding universal stress UspA family protein
MTAYRTVVAGTDGSESSLRAVDRAGEIAAASNAKLIIATGYSPHRDDQDDLRAADVLGEEGYKVHGNAPIYALLHDAHDRAKAAGAKNIEDRPIQGAPVHALVDLAEEVGADLLVVGNVGLNARSAIVARVFSIPGAVASRAKIDVLIVQTTG